MIMENEKRKEFYSLYNVCLRKQPDGVRIVYHRKYIPPFATFARSMDYLKANPYRWKRGKQTARSFKIISKDRWHPLWFRVYYNVSMRCIYIETHYIQNGTDHWFADFADDYQSAYAIIRTQITGW